MVDKIYYGVILSVLTGLMIWSIKAFVGKAIEGMSAELTHVKEGLTEAKNGMKNNLNAFTKEIKSSTRELKQHFDDTCVERQTACSGMMNGRLKRMENHGHVGLKGDDAKITG